MVLRRPWSVDRSVKTLLGVIDKSKAVTIMGLEAEVKGGWGRG